MRPRTKGYQRHAIKEVNSDARQEATASCEICPALHMSHNEVTADRYYNLQRRREMAIPMSTLINSTMTQSGQETVGTSGSLAIEDAPPSSSPKAIHNTLDSSECRTLSEVPSTSGMHEGQILPVEYQLPPAEDTDSDSDPDEHPVVKRSKTEIPTHVRPSL